MKTKVNETLKSLRLQRGYTYQNMADLLGICKAFYWKIEHNNRRVSYKLAIKIANIFELRPDDILYEETK